MNITCDTFKLFFILHFPTLNLHNQLSGVRAIENSKISRMKKTFQIYQIEKKIENTSFIQFVNEFYSDYGTDFNRPSIWFRSLRL